MIADNAPTAISTRSLGKRFGSSWALQECSIKVPRGRVTALVGPNGAAPLVAKELEHGTHNLIWTQGVTNRVNRHWRREPKR
jgi:ABC-type uncharacterized transport system ATPase subunit